MLCLKKKQIIILFCSCRAFQGPADEVAFVEQARIFGELIQAQKDSAGVDFDSYFSIQFFTGDFDTKLPYEEIWFRKL